MSMSRRDFEAIATILCDEESRGPREDTVARIAAAIANHCYSVNRHFDGTKFLARAGVAGRVHWHEGFASKEARVVPCTQCD